MFVAKVPARRFKQYRTQAQIAAEENRRAEIGDVA